MLRPAQFWLVKNVCLLTIAHTILKSCYKSCERLWIQVMNALFKIYITNILADIIT